MLISLCQTFEFTNTLNSITHNTLRGIWRLSAATVLTNDSYFMDNLYHLLIFSSKCAYIMKMVYCTCYSSLTRRLALPLKLADNHQTLSYGLICGRQYVALSYFLIVFHYVCCWYVSVSVGLTSITL